MTRRIIPLNFLVLIVATTLFGACSSTPEDAASKALNALCSTDPGGAEELVTRQSRALLHGLRLISPESFACKNAGEFTIVPANQVRDGLTIVRLEQDGRQLDLAMVQEDGRWLLDLFVTEESAFYSGNATETP